MKPIKKRLLRLTLRNPGLTATGYARLLGRKDTYSPASVLRQLHREVKNGTLYRTKEHGMITGRAWRFYHSL